MNRNIAEMDRNIDSVIASSSAIAATATIIGMAIADSQAEQIRIRAHFIRQWTRAAADVEDAFARIVNQNDLARDVL